MSTAAGTTTPSRRYPLLVFLFPVIFLVIATVINNYVPSIAPGVGPYASGYVSEFVWGAVIIGAGLIAEILVRETPAKDLGYYLAPLASALGFFILSFIVGITTPSSFVGLPVGGEYTGGEGFIALIVLAVGNDLAHYVFRVTTHDRFG